LTEIFNKAGKVVYVSIPRSDDRIKGFAFVEYEKEEDPISAVKILSEFDVEKNPRGLRVITK
jgi:RNA recognition motif-containing protein